MEKEAYRNNFNTGLHNWRKCVLMVNWLARILANHTAGAGIASHGYRRVLEVEEVFLV